LARQAEKSDRQKENERKLLDELMECLHHPSNTLLGVKGTVWAGYNAVSHYLDHRGKGARSEGRLNSIWFGEVDVLKRHAFDLALALAA
jgi:Domain of unknown function (DUF932)